MSETKGRVTIPTDLDVIPETLKMLDEWGADAIRDCDGWHLHPTHPAFSVSPESHPDLSE